MNRNLIIYFVSLAAFLGPFTQTIYTPILSDVQNEFRTTSFLINFSISIFTIILALMQIFYGPLTDKKGRRKILIPGIVVYVLASIGCAYSTSIYSLLLFRALQSIGIATGSVVATTVIGDLMEGKARGRAMGIFQMLVALGPVLGPVIGGFVGGRFGYHGVFLVLAAAGILILLGNTICLPETKPQTQGQNSVGWSRYYTVLIHPVGISVILLGYIQYYTFYCFLVFIPDILTHSYGLTPGQKGLVFLPLSLMMVIGSYLGGRLQEKLPKTVSLIITSSLNVGSILLFLFTANTSLWALMVSIGLFGILFGLSLPVQTTLLADAFVHERGTAIGMYNFFRYLGQASGPLLGSLLYHLGKLPLLFGFSALVFSGVVLFTQKQFRTHPESIRFKEDRA